MEKCAKKTLEKHINIPHILRITTENDKHHFNTYIYNTSYMRVWDWTNVIERKIVLYDWNILLWVPYNDIYICACFAFIEQRAKKIKNETKIPFGFIHFHFHLGKLIFGFFPCLSTPVYIIPTSHIIMRALRNIIATSHSFWFDLIKCMLAHWMKG